MLQPRKENSPDEDEYLGNVWGWKFSLWGLAIILLLTFLMYYRHGVLGVPLQTEESPPSPVETSR